jgi:type VII secretion effector (TIGR04197 family)
MSINSNSSIAGNISSSFSQSVSILKSISISVTSSSTNVSGNTPAMKTLNEFQRGLKDLSTSVVSAGDSIHSVAKEFDRIDQHIVQLTKFKLPGGFS